MRYQQEKTPLIVIAGREYGSGSSRDWAAKGVLPLQFREGENAESLGLTGDEVISILGIVESIKPHKILQVSATKPDGKKLFFDVILRIDADVEVDYFGNGGILQMVLRQMSAH